MYENELTLPFCANCFLFLERRGEPADRYWECPGCGERTA